MAKISYLQAIVQEFMRVLPNDKIGKIEKLPEEKQKEVFGKCFDVMYDFIKAEFIKFAMEEFKKE